MWGTGLSLSVLSSRLATMRSKAVTAAGRPAEDNELTPGDVEIE
jgi:hypothetical protein